MWPEQWLIGIERAVEIRVTSNRITVGPNDSAISFEDGAAPAAIADQIELGINNVVEDWGDPPQGFYWLPTLRYIVHPAATELYERFHSGIERKCGVTSRAAFVPDDEQRHFEATTPRTTPLNRDQRAR